MLPDSSCNVIGHRTPAHYISLLVVWGLDVGVGPYFEYPCRETSQRVHRNPSRTPSYWPAHINSTCGRYISTLNASST